jgi:hypothetical protein
MVSLPSRMLRSLNQGFDQIGVKISFKDVGVTALSL